MLCVHTNSTLCFGGSGFVAKRDPLEAYTLKPEIWVA